MGESLGLRAFDRAPAGASSPVLCAYLSAEPSRSLVRPSHRMQRLRVEDLELELQAARRREVAAAAAAATSAAGFSAAAGGTAAGAATAAPRRSSSAVFKEEEGGGEEGGQEQHSAPAADTLLGYSRADLQVALARVSEEALEAVSGVCTYGGTCMCPAGR